MIESEAFSKAPFWNLLNDGLLGGFSFSLACDLLILILSCQWGNRRTHRAHNLTWLLFCGHQTDVAEKNWGEISVVGIGLGVVRPWRRRPGFKLRQCAGYAFGKKKGQWIRSKFGSRPRRRGADALSRSQSGLAVALKTKERFPNDGLRIRIQVLWRRPPTKDPAPFCCVPCCCFYSFFAFVYLWLRFSAIILDFFSANK